MTQTEHDQNRAGSWLPDPSGRHQFRWQDASGEWTPHVADDGTVGKDPYQPPTEASNAERHKNVEPREIAPAALTADPFAGPLSPPPIRTHKRLNAHKTMADEIADLRAFADGVLRALPNGYADVAEHHEAMRRAAAAAAARQDETNAKIEAMRSEHDESMRQAAAAARARQAEIDAEIEALCSERDELQEQVVSLRDTVILQEVGVYEYAHDMESAADYKSALSDLRAKMKTVVRASDAVTSASNWVVNGSEAKGRKMIRDMSKLLLRAYNSEADDLVAKLRPFRLEAAIDRLGKSRSAINRLGAEPMKIAITSRYHRLRVDELRLAADWLAKKDDEKEAAKAERARLREEAKARKEIEAERLRLIKERTHYEGVIAKMREAGGADSDVADLEAQLAEIAEAVLTVESRAANTRAGHVYVISNVGSFGERMVKIGMTRRLDPLERVKELGDASVPFKYDLHALVFSDDAVGLEKALHGRFASRRVNLVNMRREFFYLTAGEVAAALAVGDGPEALLTEFTEEPEAAEWHMSQNTRRAHDTSDDSPTPRRLYATAQVSA